MSLKIDEEFKNLIPPLSQEEYKQLEENIIKEGCRDSLILWNGTIIDGHNRYEICTKNEIKFNTIEKDFKDRQQVIEFIILNQFGRRNLSLGNRSLLALKLEPIIREKAKEKLKDFHGNQYVGILPKSAKHQTTINTRKEIAKIAGVSGDSIDKVKKIVKEGTPEQIERIKEGGKGNTVNAVYNEVKGEPTTKKCIKCGEIFSKDYFYKGRNQCKYCSNANRSYTDSMGNIVPLDRKRSKELDELAKQIEASLSEDYEAEETIDILFDVFESRVSWFKRNTPPVIDEYKHLIKKEEDKNKIIALLLPAEETITKIKTMLKGIIL